MRQIKFRAWDGEGMFLQEDQSDEFMFEFSSDGFVLTIQDQYFEMGSGAAEERWRYIKVDAVFMQFTGLTDKNGVEIYELSEIDSFYRVEFVRCEYILRCISGGDIIGSLYKYMESDSEGKITREYSPV